MELDINVFKLVIADLQALFVNLLVEFCADFQPFRSRRPCN